METQNTNYSTSGTANSSDATSLVIETTDPMAVGVLLCVILGSIFLTLYVMWDLGQAICINLIESIRAGDMDQGM